RLEPAAVLGAGPLLGETPGHCQHYDGRQKRRTDDSVLSRDHLLTNFCRRLPSKFSPVYRLPFESTATLPTPKKAPGHRPPPPRGKIPPSDSRTGEKTF